VKLNLVLFLSLEVNDIQKSLTELKVERYLTCIEQNFNNLEASENKNEVLDNIQEPLLYNFVILALDKVELSGISAENRQQYMQSVIGYCEKFIKEKFKRLGLPQAEQAPASQQQPNPQAQAPQQQTAPQAQPDPQVPAAAPQPAQPDPPTNENFYRPITQILIAAHKILNELAKAKTISDEDKQKHGESILDYCVILLEEKFKVSQTSQSKQDDSYYISNILKVTCAILDDNNLTFKKNLYIERYKKFPEEYLPNEYRQKYRSQIQPAPQQPDPQQAPAQQQTSPAPQQPAQQQQASQPAQQQTPQLDTPQQQPAPVQPEQISVEQQPNPQQPAQASSSPQQQPAPAPQQQDLPPGVFPSPAPQQQAPVQPEQISVEQQPNLQVQAPLGLPPGVFPSPAAPQPDPFAEIKESIQNLITERQFDTYLRNPTLYEFSPNLSSRSQLLQSIQNQQNEIQNLPDININNLLETFLDDTLQFHRLLIAVNMIEANFNLQLTTINELPGAARDWQQRYIDGLQNFVQRIKTLAASRCRNLDLDIHTNSFGNYFANESGVLRKISNIAQQRSNIPLDPMLLQIAITRLPVAHSNDKNLPYIVAKLVAFMNAEDTKKILDAVKNLPAMQNLSVSKQVALAVAYKKVGELEMRQQEPEQMPDNAFKQIPIIKENIAGYNLRDNIKSVLQKPISYEQATSLGKRIAELLYQQHNDYPTWYLRHNAVINFSNYNHLSQEEQDKLQCRYSGVCQGIFNKMGTKTPKELLKELPSIE